MGRLKFTLRDLCALVLVLGVALGWWQEHRRNQRLVRDMQERSAKIEALNEAIARLEAEQMRQEMGTGVVAPFNRWRN